MMLSRQSAQTLSDSRETSPEIFQAISAVFETVNSDEIVAHWEEGDRSDEVIALASRLRADVDQPLFWGASGRVA